MKRTWLLAAAAPLLVSGGLIGLRSVTAVVVGYHLCLCLLVPALLARREGLSWRDHAQRLGLVPGGDRSGRRIELGLAFGGALALAAPLSYLLAPGLYPTGDRLREALLDWGADPGRPALLFGWLLLLNGPAEELFWRGYLQPRLWRGPRSGVALIVLFASYHVLTVGRLASGAAAAAAMLAGVLLAACFWTWSRRRWESIWPALLSHTGASAGWLAVGWHLLR